MTKTNHRQCAMQRGSARQTAWLPEGLAVVNRPVRLWDRTANAWSDGWMVREVGAIMPSSLVAERERDYLKQRQASDI